MKKFKCTVVTTNEYIVEIDETKINEKWMEDFRDSFTDIKSIEKHAENIAWHRSTNGECFYEGYGFVLVNGQKSWRDNGATEIGINIQIESEDYDIDIDVEEIK